MHRSHARALAACLLLCLAQGALSSPAELDDRAPLTLDAAVDRALAGNPDLQAFAFELKAADARGLQAGLRPAPALSIDAEDLLGNGDARGTQRAQITFALSQVIELGGKRAARRAVAGGTRSLLEIERQARQLDALAEVARRFVHVAADQAQLRLTLDASRLAAQTVQLTQARVEAGKAPGVELRRARVALARSEVEQEHAEHELLSSRQRLAASWGATATDFGPVAADLHALPPEPDFDALVAALARNPDALRYASEARLRDAEIRLAQTRRRGDLELSVGVRRLQGTQDEAFVLGLSMPLSGARRAEGAVAEAQALHGRTQAQADAHRVRVRAQLFALEQELRHALTEAEVLRERVLPEMEAALAETRDAYERGRYGLLEWIDAQRELVRIRRDYLEALANAQIHRIEIERLTGTALPSATEENPS